MKSEFFGHLSVNHIEGKWWQLITPLGYYSAKFDVTMCGPARFVTDLSSVPRLPVAYWLAGGTGNWESIPHDVGYRFGLFNRWKLDYMFYESGRVRATMRERQNALLNAGRWFRTTSMTAFVIPFGFVSFASRPGCLDYRKKCDQICRIDASKCEHYYPAWRQCVMPGYHPEILKLHGG